MPPSDALRVLDLEPEHFSFGIYRNLLITSWTAQATMSAAERLAEVTKRVARESSSGFSVAQLVREGTPMPDAETRAVFRSLMTQHQQKLACVGVVVGGDGFWASALRAVVTSAWQGTAYPFERRICGNAADLVEWLVPRHAQRTGVTLDAMTLHGLLAATRPSLAF